MSPLLPGETIAQAVTRIDAAVATKMGPFSTFADEPLYRRAARLAAELENNPSTPGRALAIRTELDALAPRLAARRRVADRFAAHFGWGAAA